MHKLEQKGERVPVEDYAASFRYAVVSSLVTKTIAAAKNSRAKAVAIAGGVSANKLLRREMASACEKEGFPFYMPRLDLCGDNAAMIGSAAYYRLCKSILAGLDLNAEPSLRL